MQFSLRKKGHMSTYYDHKELKELGFKNFGSNVMIAKNCHIVRPDLITLGSDVKIHPFCSLVSYEGSQIIIGDSIHIGGYSILFALKTITIGSNCSISTHVKIFTATEDFSGNSLLGTNISPSHRIANERPVLINSHCGIGSGSLILPGGSLALGAVLGANSMLKSETKKWSIYAGNPAKFIKNRTVILNLNY